MKRDRTYQADLKLRPMELEVVTLKAALDLIGKMVNRQIMTLGPDHSNCEIRFQDDAHRAYFSILLSDFLSAPRQFFGESADYLARLVSIGSQPLLRSDQTALLVSASEEFRRWLNETAIAPRRWFPTLDLEIDLRITRRDLVTMSGNQTKHNFTQQTRQAEKLRGILRNNGQHCRFDECLIALPDFYAQMYDDIFVYHTSTISAFLNDVRWGIFEYARPEREKCTKSQPFDSTGQLIDRYHYPASIQTLIGRHYYWELMNAVRSRPPIPRFVVTRFLRGIY